MSDHYDIIIVGTGAGGGTLAYALRNTSLKVLLIERGDFLPQEEENESRQAAYGGSRYGFVHRWKNICCNSIVKDLGHIYCVGGKTKVYGSALLRLKKEDFHGLNHRYGTLPAWPVSYDELEPYYSEAEHLYSVHGVSDNQISYPHPPLPYDPHIQKLVDKFLQQGLHPSPIPIGIIAEKRHTINPRKFDGYPSKTHAKAEAEVCCIRPALQSEHISLLTQATAHRLLPDAKGKKIVSVEVIHQGKTKLFHAKQFVLACGAIHSPEILLRSKIANSSGLVGKNLMMHTTSGIICIHPFQKNQIGWQKSFQITDYYLKGPDGLPWGLLQSLGHMAFASLLPRGLGWAGDWLTNHSIQFAAVTEDLPDPANSVKLNAQDKISICYRNNNCTTHKIFRKEMQRILRKAIPFSYPLTILASGPTLSLCHACGTLPFGKDPKKSVLNPYCRTHDVENLYVVDASFFPSSGAVNPALTIMAQALRVGEHLCKSVY